jgi:hypothetical protein
VTFCFVFIPLPLIFWSSLFLFYHCVEDYTCFIRDTHHARATTNIGWSNPRQGDNKYRISTAYAASHKSSHVLFLRFSFYFTYSRQLLLFASQLFARSIDFGKRNLSFPVKSCNTKTWASPLVLPDDSGLTLYFSLRPLWFGTLANYLDISLRDCPRRTMLLVKSSHLLGYPYYHCLTLIFFSCLFFSFIHIYGKIFIGRAARDAVPSILENTKKMLTTNCQYCVYER